ncbi:MAG: hypothetical protein ACKVOW_18405 [Chitinophagaceae bacterium]
MKELTTGWKVFRFVCILQLIVVGFQLVLSVLSILQANQFYYSLISSLIYLVLFLFLYQGVLIISNNYPDTPLGPGQKKYFNWLFLLNVLAIAFLFGQVISKWRVLVPLLNVIDAGWLDYLFFSFPLFLVLITFGLHLLFLIGIYKLRRLLYQNTIERWQQQFSDTPE